MKALFGHPLMLIAIYVTIKVSG